VTKQIHHQPETLNIATWMPCTTAEGPGVRFALWVQGCTLRCPGCCNPEMFADAPRYVMSIEEIMAMLLEARREHEIEGITVLGGEPFEQAEALARLAARAQAEGLSVMIFSGFTREELATRGDAAAALLSQIDILVDGRYDRALHTESRRWIGSTNQRVHFLSERYDPDDPRWAAPNSIDIHFDGKELYITGFPEGPWKEALQQWQAWQKKRRG